jgi:hypothetical protein
MRSKIIVMANEATLEQRNQVTLAIKALGNSWWHWFEQAWVISDYAGRDVAWWRTFVTASAPGLHVLVLRVYGKVDWAGFGVPDRFTWLDKWSQSD